MRSNWRIAGLTFSTSGGTRASVGRRPGIALTLLAVAAGSLVVLASPVGASTAPAPVLAHYVPGTSVITSVHKVQLSGNSYPESVIASRQGQSDATGGRSPGVTA
jgi:hypothetical protein